LREEDAPRRQFEIFIGAPEAAAIKTALDAEPTPRPLTHDLFVLALERVSVSVSRVVLTHVSNGTYYADLVLTPDGGPEVTVSSRPSDALAIALRASCPIFVLDDLIDLVGEAKAQGAALQAHLKQAGIDITGLYRLRLVTHLDVDRAGVDRAISAVRHFFNA